MSTHARVTSPSEQARRGRTRDGARLRFYLLPHDDLRAALVRPELVTALEAWWRGAAAGHALQRGLAHFDALRSAEGRTLEERMKHASASAKWIMSEAFGDFSEASRWLEEVGAELSPSDLELDDLWQLERALRLAGALGIRRGLANLLSREVFDGEHAPFAIGYLERTEVDVLVQRLARLERTRFLTLALEAGHRVVAAWTGRSFSLETTLGGVHELARHAASTRRSILTIT